MGPQVLVEPTNSELIQVIAAIKPLCSGFKTANLSASETKASLIIIILFFQKLQANSLILLVQTVEKIITATVTLCI